MSFTASCLPTRVRPSIKIGLVAPFEGPYRAVGYDVIYAVRLALQEANASGGVGGYTVELVAYDDRGEITGAVEQARKIVTDPDVVAVLGHFRPTTTRAVLSTYSDAGVPLVVPGDPLGGIWLEGTPIYSVAPTEQRVSSVLGRYLNPRSCIVVSNEQVAERRDTELCDKVVMWDNKDNTRAAVLDAGANSVFTDMDAVSAGELSASLRDAGWAGRIIGGQELVVPGLVSVAGDAAEGVRFLTCWPLNVDVSGFTSSYRDVSHGVDPGPFAVLAYESTRLLLSSIEQSIVATGSLSRIAVGRALRQAHHNGILGRLSFDSTHHWLEAPVCIYEIRQGQPFEISCQRSR